MNSCVCEHFGAMQEGFMSPGDCFLIPTSGLVFCCGDRVHWGNSNTTQSVGDPCANGCKIAINVDLLMRSNRQPLTKIFEDHVHTDTCEPTKLQK